MKIADYILIIVLSVLSISFLTIQIVSRDTNNLAAVIHYHNNAVVVVDLSSIDNDSVTIISDDYKSPDIKITATNGYITFNQEDYLALYGDLTVEFKKDAIRVSEEESPLNICSDMGWVSTSNQTITCLPNRVYIDVVPADDVDEYINKDTDF